MLSRAWSYIVKAGTIILVCNFAVHLMQNFDWTLQVVANPNDSILHDVALPFGYAIAPVIGVCAWQLAAAAVTGTR
jgi:ferrous iron transport protein B